MLVSHNSRSCYVLRHQRYVAGTRDKQRSVHPCTNMTVTTKINCFFFLQTISRTSSRRSRAGSSQSKKPGDKGQSSASDSENEDTRTRVSDFDNQADIMDEKAWETDLEPEGINSFILFLRRNY